MDESQTICIFLDTHLIKNLRNKLNNKTTLTVSK
jgi:hypothetical protein